MYHQDLQLVKMEVEDTQPQLQQQEKDVSGKHAQAITTTTTKNQDQSHQRQGTATTMMMNTRSAGRNEHVVLALLNQDHPPVKKPKISFSLGKLKQKKEKSVKIKKKHSGAKDKHVTPDLAGKCDRCKQNNSAIDNFISAGESKSPAMIRAEEVRSNLETAFPSFIKCLVRSHVGSCFWMGLPGLFCRAHMPDKDCTVILEDENGRHFQMKYIAYKTGLSAGWRQFCVAHNLVEGDVLVFQLIEPIKFKVYVIRANDLTEVDGALGLLNLDAQPKQNDAGKFIQSDMSTCKCSKKKQQKSLPLTTFQRKNKKNGTPGSAPNIGQTAEQSENDSEEVGSEVLEGFKLSRPSLQFQEIDSLADFRILVDGYPVDLELSEDIRIKYYKLCCSQRAFLHENFIEGISFKLAVGAITEIVNIAGAVGACNLTTSKDEFASWDKTLRALELLGMNVGFLRARIRRLYKLAYESEDALDARKYVEARTKLEKTEDEIRSLEARLVELKEASQRFGADIESLETRAESYELRFQEQVLAPW